MIRYFVRFWKKRYIRKELRKKIAYLDKNQSPFFIPSRNISKRKLINELTNGIYIASLVVKKEINVENNNKLERENQKLFADIKSVIDKYYGNIEAENIKLTRQINSLKKQESLKVNRNFESNRIK